MAVCFHKGGLGHTAGILECHILKPFHKCFNGISFLLSHCQESWYDNLQVIFNEMGEESFSRSLQFLIEPSASFMNHSKAIPFRVLMKNVPVWHHLILCFQSETLSSICVGSVTPCIQSPVGSEF